MYNFFIINKSGGLIYTLHRDEEPNKHLILLSSLHTIYAFVTEIDFLFTVEEIQPLVIVLSKNTITLFRSITGYTFVFVDSKAHDHCRFKDVYGCFIDYALKDPFYADEMPLNSKKFDLKIKNALDRKKFFWNRKNSV